MIRITSTSLTALAVILATPLLGGSGNIPRDVASGLAEAQTALVEVPLANADVVKLFKMGLGDEIVIAKINQAKSVDFQLGTDDLGKLLEQGVSKSIIAAMVKRATPQVGILSRQTSTKVQEPEFLGTFFFLDSTTGKLTPLERQTPVQNAKVKAMGLGGAKMSMMIGGDRSPVRFKEGQPLDFVVLTSSQQIDPQSIAHLFFLETTQYQRRLEVAQFGLFSGGGASSQTSAIPFDASKYGLSSFKITPIESLFPGEYILTGAMSTSLAGPSTDGFCFGIDPDPTNKFPRSGQIVEFRPGEVIPLGIMKGAVTIQSVQVTTWPKPVDLQKAEGQPGDMTSLTLKFTYANQVKQEWKCKYHVVVLDDKGVEIGSGERKAGLNEEQKSDTNRVSVKMRTLDFPKAAKLRIRVSLALKIEEDDD